MHVCVYMSMCGDKGSKLRDSSYISTHLVNLENIFCLDQQSSTVQESFCWFLLNAKIPGIPCCAYLFVGCRYLPSDPPSCLNGKPCTDLSLLPTSRSSAKKCDIKERS